MFYSFFENLLIFIELNLRRLTLIHRLYQMLSYVQYIRRESCERCLQVSNLLRAHNPYWFIMKTIKWCQFPFLKCHISYFNNHDDRVACWSLVYEIIKRKAMTKYHLSDLDMGEYKQTFRDNMTVKCWSNLIFNICSTLDSR